MFKHVAAGYKFSVGVTSIGGFVNVWGGNAWVTQGIPTVGGFRSVAAGWDHGLALHSDGWLAAWSTSNYQGQFGMGSVPIDPYSVGQEFPVIYTAIAAGEWFNLALRANGTIWAWGDNSWSVLSINSDPENVAGAFVAIAAGGHHGVALRSNGKIKNWGGVGYDANNCSSSPHPGTGFPSNLANAVFIGIGAGHTATYGILADGQRTVIGWGCSCAVQEPTAIWIGNSNHTDGYYLFASGAATVSGGYDHGLQLTSKTGAMQAWGRPDQGCNNTSGPPPNVVPAVFQQLNVLMIGANNVGEHNAFIYEPPIN